MPIHTPTDEQQAVIDAMPREESIICEAYAGAAKSTTLEMAAPRVRSAALALAFNKRIADELRPRLPPSFTVKTLNSLGYAAWAKALGGAKLQLNDRKVGDFLREHIRGAKRDVFSREAWDNARRLVSAAMSAGLVPQGEGEEGLLRDEPASWRDLAEELAIDADDLDEVYDLARAALRWDIEQARQGIVSFDDQIYCPTLLGGHFPLFPVIFVDEAQDLSPLNHQMLRRASSERTKLVVVGDRRQSIYAFRGADSQSIPNLRKLQSADRWLERPLRTTFRCPKLIVARQSGHAPGFTAASICKPGRLEDWRDHSDGWSAERLFDLAQRSGYPSDGGSIAILCRNNAPLMSLAFKLIRRGIGPQVLGRDIGKGLVALSKKIEPNDAASAIEFAAKLKEWEDREIALALANRKEERLDGISDRAECLRAVLSDGGVRDVGQLRASLERLFAREGGRLVLSSIHKSKGLEWPVVLHLDPWRLPSRFAREAAKRGSPTELEQERNLLYVAETRSKDVLILANLSEFY